MAFPYRSRASGRVSLEPFSVGGRTAFPYALLHFNYWVHCGHQLESYSTPDVKPVEFLTEHLR